MVKLNKIYVAGSNGMVGKAIVRALKKSGYGEKGNKGILLTPSREELNLLYIKDVEKWFQKNKLWVKKRNQ